MATTRNFADLIRKELAADPELAAVAMEESFNTNIAQQVYDARMEANLTQQQLADRCATRQSVISRIEDADYYGHSVALLKRIASALGKSVHIEFRDLPDYAKPNAHANGRPAKPAPSRRKPAPRKPRRQRVT